MRRTTLINSACFLLPLIVCYTSIVCSTSIAAEDEFPTAVAPFLNKHCGACHGSEQQESRIRFDRLEGYQPRDRQLWSLVHKMLTAETMPPEGNPQPSTAEKNRILSWIERQQRAHRGGNTRRLNRRELSAALQDLTGLAVDYSLSLPEDGKVNGFDTGANGLQDAADSVARIMEVTRRAVNGLRFLEPARSQVLSADLRNQKDIRKAFDHWKEAGAYVKVRGHNMPGSGLLIEPKWLGERGGFSFSVQPPDGRRGILRLKLVVSAFKGEFDGIPNPHLWVEIGNNDVDFVEITATVDEPQELVYEVQIENAAIEKRGLGITLHNKVELPYAVKGFENDERSKPEDSVPGGTGLFRPAYDRKQKLPPERQPFPFVVLEQVEVETDYVATWPPADWPTVEIDDSEDSAVRLLRLWIERAWRRPVNAEELQRFLDLYRTVRGQDASFDQAVRAMFQAVLLSAPFRYLPASGDEKFVIARHAVASRLSFMLVGAPPDEELRRLAASGELLELAVFDAQVDRLLADPRSEAFVRPFVMQWLEMEQPITIAMDHIQKQDFRFGRYLKQSMQDETVAYVGRLLAENRPARELIQSDWTMMNNILAWHYGYEGIDGGALRKIKLRPDDPRGGGLLGHAGIQSMLCWMGDNWVIYRGAWTLRHILDDPPPPPPLEVPDLNPADGANRGKTFKELLAQHQADSRCAVCHESIDPLGFAFQNFDLSGRWRDVEYERYERSELDGKIAWQGKGKIRPVDAAGKLPRGETFESFAECKVLMVKHYQDDMVRGLLKNLLLYATGRRPDTADMAEIRAIMQEERPDGYRLCDLLKAVVRSRAFLNVY